MIIKKNNEKFDIIELFVKDIEVFLEKTRIFLENKPT